MPYIKVADRKPFDEKLQGLVITRPGELAYCFVVCIKSYLSTRGITFESLSSVLGVLSAIDNEFYRRVVAPVEVAKQAENGDVSWF